MGLETGLLMIWPLESYACQAASGDRILDVDDHLFVDVGVAHDVAKLLEADLAILVLKRKIISGLG